MKKTFIKTICFGTLLASMAACDILDVDPLDTYTEEDVFSDVSLLKSYVHRNYNLPQTGWDHTALRYSCDESINNFNWNILIRFLKELLLLTSWVTLIFGRLIMKISRTAIFSLSTWIT